MRLEQRVGCWAGRVEELEPEIAWPETDVEREGLFEVSEDGE